MYITDGYRPACDIGHTRHQVFYAYACRTSSRVRNPAFSGADGFFTHSDIAWSALIRGSTNMYSYAHTRRSVSHAVKYRLTESIHLWHMRSGKVALFAGR